MATVSPEHSRRAKEVDTYCPKISPKSSFDFEYTDRREVVSGIKSSSAQKARRPVLVDEEEPEYSALYCKTRMDALHGSKAERRHASNMATSLVRGK